MDGIREDAPHGSNEVEFCQRRRPPEVASQPRVTPASGTLSPSAGYGRMAASSGTLSPRSGYGRVASRQALPSAPHARVTSETSQAPRPLFQGRGRLHALPSAVCFTTCTDISGVFDDVHLRQWCC